MTYHAKVIAGGKIVIPAELRRDLGIRDGDILVIDHEDGALVVRTYAEVVRSVQEQIRALRRDDGGAVVDTFLAEKRLESDLEAARGR